MRKYILPACLLFALLLLSSVLTACSFSLAADITPPPGSEQQLPAGVTQPAPISGQLYPLLPPNPESGRAIYTEKCAPCHGDSGKGDGPRAAQLPNPVAAIGSIELARQSTPARWYTQVTQGNLEKFMPPFGSLSERQRWDVVAYAFSLSAPAALLEQGKELYQANCTRCHGASGKGDGPDAAGAPKPPPDLTDQAFMAQKSAEDFYQVISNGLPPTMPSFITDLSDDERWTLATYLRSLTFAQPEEPVTLAESATPGDATGVATSVAPAPNSTASPITATPLAEVPSGTGTVTGNVISSSGVKLPDDLEITLHGFDNMQVAITQTTTLQPDGSFTFPDVQMPAGRVFLATVNYQNASYGSDIGTVQEGVTTLDLPIKVYETTTDASILKGDRLHLFFEFVDAKTVRVIELYIVSNPTDKTLVAEPGQPTARFSLPKGATNLEFQDGALGGRYIQTSDGFGDTASISPGSGSYEVLFAYEMPYDRKLELEQVLSMPMEAVVILVPEGVIKIKSDILQDSGSRDVQGTPYHTYSGSRLAAGETLRLTLTGSPSSGSPGLAASSKNNLLVGLSVFGVALIVAGVWLYRRTRSVGEQTDRDQALTMSDNTSSDSAENLMDAIIALDDLYRSGQLPEEPYQQRRAELKARLKEILGDKG
jgi:mono/diheme cytochrome c family protein